MHLLRTCPPSTLSNILYCLVLFFFYLSLYFLKTLHKTYRLPLLLPQAQFNQNPKQQQDMSGLVSVPQNLYTLMIDHMISPIRF